MSRGRMQERYPSAGQPFSYRVEESSPGVTVYLDGEAIEIQVERRGTTEGWCRWQGRVAPFATAWVGDELHVWLDGSLFIFRRLEEEQRDRRALLSANGEIIAPGAGRGSAPMQEGGRHVASRISGVVLLVSVQAGDRVSAGDEVCVIEAMKMEHSIRAAAGGVVKAVNVAPGQQVSFGDVLVELADEPAVT